MRLDKAVTACGVSRSDAKKLISSGRVTVNGLTVTDPGAQLGEGAAVSVDGSLLEVRANTHIMINKPAGYLTATEDARGSLTVMDLLSPALKRLPLGPVGRLDKDVTGLVILTTDGQLAHRLISPKRGHVKRYEAVCEGRLEAQDAEAFAAGMDLGDFIARGARLEILEAGAERSRCLVCITEGKYHQVKRMLEAVGHPVISLKRLAIASAELDPALREGEYRLLTQQEADALYKTAEMENK